MKRLFLLTTALLLAGTPVHAKTPDQLRAEFIDLTQARGLSVIELELLRLAYEYVM